MPRPRAACLWLALLGLFWVPRAEALRAEQVGHVNISLLSEVEAFKPGQPFTVALRFEMDPSWHINWRNPGDAGLPPEVTWTLPPGFSAGEIQWPVPERLVVPPLASFGYEGTVLLPVEITPPSTWSGEAVLAADVDWLVCSHVCIPGAASVSLTLPAKDAAPQTDPRYSTEFADTRFRLPIQSPDWSLNATLSDSAMQLSFTPPSWWQGDLGEVFFLPYASDQVAHNGSQHLVREGDQYRLTVPRASGNPVSPERAVGILVSSSGWRGEGTEAAVAIDVAFQAEPVAGVQGSLWTPLLFAFLGGLILNLMPCVLPVLSIKVLGLVQASGDVHRSPFAHSLLYTAGVLVSFWILAGLLIALRGAGAALGWGFQLQSPLFVLAMAGLFFLLGLSLLGVFEMGTRLMGVGSGASQRAGALGTFNSGILAVVVATPCTAPFMGSALGYALTQGPAQAVAIFTALGLGLAFPYVVLASSPALLRFVPKPGAWMETLKQLFGFLMLATVVWLAWVLGNQAGPGAVAVLLSVLLLLAMAAWIWGRWGALSRSDRSRRFAAWAGSLLLVLAAAGGARGVMLFGSAPAGASEQEWVPYNERELERLVSGGTPVLVDFTADWCLSCKVNEQVALESSSVRKRVQELGVVLMKADWTRRSEEITRALARFGRSSVPLYVLYSGEGPDRYVTLPELLTPGLVVQALDQLLGSTPTTGGNT